MHHSSWLTYFLRAFERARATRVRPARHRRIETRHASARPTLRPASWISVRKFIRTTIRDWKDKPKGRDSVCKTVFKPD